MPTGGRTTGNKSLLGVLGIPEFMPPIRRPFYRKESMGTGQSKKVKRKEEKRPNRGAVRSFLRGV